MSRYIALDAFRGFTIAAMILVNLPGSRANAYGPLLHANWHGWTPTDFVFPFFVFIVGSAMYFSLSAQKNKSSGAVIYQILKRGFIIFSIGLMINALSLFAEPISQLRIMGVLQRIAVAYVFASLIAYFFSQRVIIIASISLLLFYWALLTLAGDLSVEGNIVRDFDLAIFGANHMWTMNGIAFDPEGLLSTIPAIVSTLAGYEITRLLVAQKDKLTAIKKMIFIGVSLAIAGLIWNFWLPINKPLWTSSYVIFTSGIGALTLAVFIWIVDIQKIKWLEKPFTIYGQNSLFIYVLSMIWPKVFLYVIAVSASDGSTVSGYRWLYSQLAIGLSPANASLAFALIHVVLFWLIAYGLHRKNILIKI